MKWLLQLDRRLYLFSFYVILVFVWAIQEWISFRSNLDCLKSNQKFIELAEISIALLPAVGIYILIQELIKNKKDLDQGIATIEALHHQNQKLSHYHTEGFWKSAEKEFKKWNLTEKEIEIALLIFRGMSNQQIAAIRGKSLKTIENQTLSIYQKSGMTGKLEFLAYFLSPLLPEED
jgi:DNA-binding CsgD family transcriptional regulator